jgi:hypothetical protein
MRASDLERGLEQEMKRWTGLPCPLTGLTMGASCAVVAGYGVAAAVVAASSI